MTKISVLIVDDHAVVREGLKALISAELDMEVVGEAENGRKAIELARKLMPEVVIMDLAMPEMNGLEATRELRRVVPGVRVLVLSSYGDEDSVQGMLRAGVMGYLLKKTAANELTTAIRNVRRGGEFYSPAISQRLRSLQQRGSATGKEPVTRGGLTEREAQVLQLIAEGYSNKEIAVELGISAKTVEKHRQQVMNKLNIHEIAGLTRYAISKGMVSPQKL